MLKTSLLPYQTQAVTDLVALLKQHRLAQLEAGMGTGKTIMAMAVVGQMLPQRLVIVAPKTLCSTWRKQMQEHSDLEFSMIWDAQKSTSDRYKKELYALSQSKQGIFFCNVEAFGRDNERLLTFITSWKGEGSMVIFDESSKLKDQGAHRTKTISKAFSAYQYNMGMTGTLNANSPLDVFGQFLCLSPSFWKSQGYRNWHIFRSSFAILEDIYAPGGVVIKGGKIVGYRRLTELNKLIRPYIVTVDKSKVLDLPEKIRSTISIALGKEEQKAYSEIRDQLMTMLSDGRVVAVDQVMGLYNKLRMITGGWIETTTPLVDMPSKLAALIDLLEDSDEQVLIFANYTHEINQLVQELSKNMAVKKYDGSVGMEDREQIVAEFNDRRIQVIVAQPMAGSYGLNLQTNCNTIIKYSRPNSPEVDEQSDDRIHRIGQTKICYYIDLVVENSIDQKVIDALASHQDLSKIFRENARQYL